MKKAIITFVLSLLPVLALAAGGSGYPLDHIETDHSDKASLQRGAKQFMAYCAGCHATQFQRFERVADDIGIPHDLMMKNLMSKDSKIGNLMFNNMDEKEAKVWFGATPPDLTMVTRVRGEDWLYTYLRTFYEDNKRPWGVNNKVFPDVGMPHVLMELQGVQIDNCGDTSPTAVDPLTGEKVCGLTVDPKRKGSMEPKQFDQAMYDLTNFLSYSAEPMKLERQSLGIYVLLFIVLLFIVTLLLKREYWKDVH
ncbi:cytochrome c1 [Endozoicomonas sp. OPT23]|uniref:cytochrome c1 n=1 Tax=Endozoicomonas sp. OPT23 TaxID=2072845 RepID=UPI00129A2566|nr:cytochrome c1 [Endozoicomonas sp. OPT23]MRI32315.1 cytochrome c1 [Endozoicomonas sp. OPT23]